MCIGAIVETNKGRRGEIISIDIENKMVVIHGIFGGYWTEEIKYIKVVSYSNVI